VLTPDGFINIEDTKVGDQVVTPSGSIERITGVFPQGAVQLYRVEFQDGRSVETCGEHLWKFHRSGNGSSNSIVGNTLEMLQHLGTVKQYGKGSPIIPLVSPLSDNSTSLPLPPYLVGCLLGDGYLPLKGQPSLTSADPFIIEELARDGVDIGGVTRSEGNLASQYSIKGVRSKLRDLCLEGTNSFTKFIPEEYKNGSCEDKFSIIQGLFDTDGYVSPDGKTYYYTVSKDLAKDVREILYSLGFSVTTTIKVGKYKKDGEVVICGDCYCLYVRGKNQKRLFRLPRKVNRAKEKNVGLKVVSIVPTRVGYATCISISGEEKLFVTTNYIVTHNTRMCLTKYLAYLSDKNFRGVVFRQSFPQLSAPGGIIDESHQIYPYFGGIYKAQAKKWVFPSGATLQFAAIGDDRDLPGWQGSQLTNVLVDEAAEWTEKQILFLLTRMRSANFKGKLQMILSTNPSNTSYLFDWLLPLLDEDTGVPREGTENIIRWFVVIDDKVRFGPSPEALYEEFGTGKTLGVDFIPKSIRMIPLSVYDNTILLKNNPEYLANLLSQSKINQLRFLKGSWTAVANGGVYWNKSFTEGQMIDVQDLPEDITWVRYYDFGSSEPSSALPNPDWSCGVKLGRQKSTGNYFVADVLRFRKSLQGILDEVERQAFIDGTEECQVGIPRDPGAGGKFANLFMTRELAERGIPTKTEIVSGHSSKLSKFLPFCSMCEAKAVYYVRAHWNDDFFNELSIFDGGNRKTKDDQVDALSSSFRALARANTLPTFSLGNDAYTRPSPIN